MPTSIDTGLGGSELLDIVALAEEEVLRDLKRERDPVGHILGGQPGSGKARLISGLASSHTGTIAILNGDDLRRYHPQYYRHMREDDRSAADKTQGFANFLVQHLYTRCVEERYSLIIEGTMRHAATPMATARDLRKHAYRTRAHVIAAHPEQSRLGIHLRYEVQKHDFGFGRFSNLAVHDAALSQVPHTADLLYTSGAVSRMDVYSFQATHVLDSFRASSEKKSRHLPSHVIGNEHVRALSPVELSDLIMGWSRVLHLRQLRGDFDNKDIVARMGDLLQRVPTQNRQALIQSLPERYGFQA